MISAATRRIVAERAWDCCEYCGCSSEVSSSPYAVEHIHPRDLGGTDDLENLAWSCHGCNGHKGIAVRALDPRTLKQAILYHPDRHSWRRHFTWSEDGLRMRGRTATGRATIERLKLNRPGVINLRKMVIAFGQRPFED